MIIGSVGSGKSTYSKKLSNELDIEVYELDSIIHNDKLGIKRTEKEIKKIINNINKKNDWIIEGTLRKYVYYLLKMADKIIVIEPSYRVRKIRIFKRFIKQKLKIEKCNYKPTLKMLFNMFKWNKKYEKEKKEFYKLLSKYEKKVEIKK